MANRDKSPQNHFGNAMNSVYKLAKNERDDMDQRALKVKQIKNMIKLKTLLEQKSGIKITENEIL